MNFTSTPFAGDTPAPPRTPAESLYSALFGDAAHAGTTATVGSIFITFMALLVKYILKRRARRRHIEREHGGDPATTCADGSECEAKDTPEDDIAEVITEFVEGKSSMPKAPTAPLREDHKESNECMFKSSCCTKIITVPSPGTVESGGSPAFTYPSPYRSPRAVSVPRKRSLLTLLREALSKKS